MGIRGTKRQRDAFTFRCAKSLSLEAVSNFDRFWTDRDKRDGFVDAIKAAFRAAIKAVTFSQVKRAGKST